MGGIGSILRLNAWFRLKGEKISNQNIQDQLWALFRPKVCAKLGQFEKLRYISDVLIAFS